MITKINTKYYVKYSYLEEFVKFIDNSYHFEGRLIKHRDHSFDSSGLDYLKDLQMA